MTIIRPILLLLVLLATQLYSGDASSPAKRLFHFQSRRNHAHCSSKRRLHATNGTLLRFKRPTTERVSTWFPSIPEPEFNHDDVGMTTPCLHIDSKSRDSSSVVHVSASGTPSCDSNWWPASPVSKGWRRLRLSRRVGRGSTCYQAVRDSALEWEFADEKECGGIVQVHSKQSHAEQLYQRRDSYGTGYDVVHNAVYGDGDLYAPSGESAVKIWLGPGGRRLATFTQVFRSRWLPKVYCVNPVTVVYDLVDQRGSSTTYTSTAYATSRGHWLRGEERLTVAHRDDGNVDVEILSYSKHGNSVWGRIIWPFVGPLQGRFFESQLNALQNVAEQHSNDIVDERQTVPATVGTVDDTNVIPVRRW